MARPGGKSNLGGEGQTELNYKSDTSLIPIAKSSERLLIATFNPGKMREFRTFFEGLPYLLISLDEIPDVSKSQETGDTFEANAREKALHYSKYSNWLTLAEDSGLEVDALGGLPGVHSARLIHELSSDRERIMEILRRMHKIPEAERTARFICCIALARQQEIQVLFRGVLEGRITQEPRGSQGFGYDPIFLLPNRNKTLAELTTREKDEISHRGKALRTLLDYLKRVT